MGVFDVFQIPYSAVQREHEDLISQAAAAGAGTLIRGGAARGAPAEDKGWKQGPIGLSEGEGQRRWEASGIDDLLGDMSRLEFVLRFTLSHPDLSSTIVGTSSLGHLRSNLAIAEKGPCRPTSTSRLGSFWRPSASKCQSCPGEHPDSGTPRLGGRTRATWSNSAVAGIQTADWDVRQGSCRFEIEEPAAMGQVTLWEGGECEVDLGSATDPTRTLIKSAHPISTEALIDLLEEAMSFCQELLAE